MVRENVETTKTNEIEDPKVGHKRIIKSRSDKFTNVLSSESTSQVNLNNSENKWIIKQSEFIFQSIGLNETNFPLENPKKCVSHELIQETVLNYSFSDSTVKHYVKFPSVSKIMEETMSDKNKLLLNKWRERMIHDLGQDRFSKHCEGKKHCYYQIHYICLSQFILKSVNTMCVKSKLFCLLLS